MVIYLLVLALIVGLGCLIEIGKVNHWEGLFVYRKNTYRFSLTNVFWVLIFITLTLFGGLRYNVGTDFEGYCEIFTNIAKDWYVETYAGTERGYVWLNRLVSLFTDEPQVIIFLTNLIICWVGIVALKKFCTFAPFGIYIFYTTLYYSAFNLIRQGMAVAFCFLAFGHARDGKIWRAVFWVLVGSLFHNTALLMLPLILLFQIKFKPPVYFAVFGVSALLTLLRDSVTIKLIMIFYPYNIDFAGSYSRNFSPTQVILCGIYMILCILYYKSLLEKKKGNILYVNMAIFIFGMYSLLFWVPEWTTRLNMYFLCLYAFIVPEVISCERSRKLRCLYYAGIWGILLFFYIVPSLLSGEDWYYATCIEKFRELKEEALWP